MTDAGIPPPAAPPADLLPVHRRATVSSQDLARLGAYYDQTWLDYRLLWLNARNYAVHFGYWDERTRGHADALLRMNAVLAEALAIRPGERVLDAGCGVGGSAVWLARQFGATVVGITPVASQVERARQYARRQGVDAQISFAQQDYAATDFPSASFDVVWAIESVCHAPDKLQVLREAHRLLRPGGRLGMVEYLRTARPHPQDGERLLHSWLDGWAIPDIATREEFVAWGSEAGFGRLNVRDISANVRPSLRRLYRLAAVSWPVACLLRAARLRSGAQHGNVRGARDQWRAFQRGLWREAVLTGVAAPLSR